MIWITFDFMTSSHAWIQHAKPWVILHFVGGLHLHLYYLNMSLTSQNLQEWKPVQLVNSLYEFCPVINFPSGNLLRFDFVLTTCLASYSCGWILAHHFQFILFPWVHLYNDVYWTSTTLGIKRQTRRIRIYKPYFII